MFLRFYHEETQTVQLWLCLYTVYINRVGKFCQLNMDIVPIGLHMNHCIIIWLCMILSFHALRLISQIRLIRNFFSQTVPVMWLIVFFSFQDFENPRYYPVCATSSLTNLHPGSISTSEVIQLKTIKTAILLCDKYSNGSWLTLLHLNHNLMSHNLNLNTVLWSGSWNCWSFYINRCGITNAQHSLLPVQIDLSIKTLH